METPTPDPEKIPVPAMDPEHALLELSSQFMEHGHKSIALVVAAGVAQIRDLKKKQENLISELKKDEAYFDRMGHLVRSKEISSVIEKLEKDSNDS